MSVLALRLAVATCAVLPQAAVVVAREAQEPAEPRLFQSSLTVEPTARQVATMPRAAAEWRIAPATAAGFEAVLAAEAFSEALATALRDRLRLQAESGEGTIVPDAALLDLFQPEERGRWWAMLARHPAHRSYRWPIAVRLSRLETMSVDPAFAEAVRRIRSWGVVDSGRVMFADLFALDDAFAREDDRIRFFRKFFAADSIFAKVETGGLDAPAAAGLVRYWQGEGRSRDVGSILAAASRIEGHDRIDIAHLLPRLVRALLYTFPPNLGVQGEPPVENAAVAVSFFSPALDTRAALAGGLSAWLAASCDEVRGDRELGDIVVFEDPARTRWPFSMVYVADGVLFGRRPTIYGPWELLKESDALEINRRLRGNLVRTFRQRRSDATQAESIVGLGADSPSRPATELKEIPPGPWGRLRYYEVQLSPSTELFDRLPVPSEQPKWVFRGISADEIRETIAAVDMAPDIRSQLEVLFTAARPDRDGLITVRPSKDLVFSTPAEFRTRLFSYLVVYRGEETTYTQSVGIATRADPEDWFVGGAVSDRSRRAVLDLVYRRGDALALSDFGALYHVASDPRERYDLLKFAYRSPVLIVLLERPEPGEVAGVAEYWRLDQQKSVGTLLQSFAEVPDVRYLDVVHLVPALAREMMNVFIRAPLDAPTPSCYWTALNFNAERPDSRLLITPGEPGPQHDLVMSRLKDDYVRVDVPSQLGDVIMYRSRADGEVRHLCTYIAGDVVYTKNGFGSLIPWCLMHVADVDALYLQPGKVERLTFRQKGTPPTVNR